MTLARSRGSAVSARHIAVSSGFISAAMPQSSGTSGGADPLPAPASVTVGRGFPDQLASASTYMPRTSSTFAPRSFVVQPSVGTGGRTRTCTVPDWIVVEPRHISSPALRMTMGMIGTPACMATWKAPFLNGPSDGVAERVPSGAMTSEMPSRSFSTAGSSALRASVAFFRSTKATSASRKASPKPGVLASSFLATPVKPPRSTLARTSTSSWLWWLNRKTAGRAARCSAPCTSMRTPASALPSSPARVMPRSTASRREPLSAPIATPAPKPPSSPPMPAAVRTSSSGPPRPRRRNRAIGHE